MHFAKHTPSTVADQSGASTVEFAILMPLFLMVIIGGMNLSMLGYSAAGLQYAAQGAARCASINTATCANATSTQTYATKLFTNITGNTPSFVATNQSCGKQVSGSVSFTLNAGITAFNIPLTSVACFPI